MHDPPPKYISLLLSCKWPFQVTRKDKSRSTKDYSFKFFWSKSARP